MRIAVFKPLVLLITAIAAMSAVMSAEAVVAAPKKGKGASVRVVGKVKDAESGELLEYVTVYSKKGKRSTTTDLNGIFTLRVPVGSEVQVSSLGYETMTKKAKAAPDTMIFLLHPSETTLDEFVVKPKKQKYSKKNNPAVELMRKVRENRDLHNPVKNSDYYSYDRYDKIILALNDYKGGQNIEIVDSTGKSQKKKTKKYFSNFIDTAIWSGKRILTLSLKEKLATRLTQNHGSDDKQVVTATKSAGLDQQFDKDFTRVFFEEVLREVDIYDNDITVMQSKFVGPLSSISADYYMYHIEDTVQIGNERCVELSFAPHNPQSMGFNGKLYIPVEDSVKYVRRAMLRLPKGANVNYVKNLYLSQNFMTDSLGQTHKTLDDMVVELQIIPGTQAAHVSRQSRYDDFSYKKREDLAEYYDRVGSVFETEEATGRDGAYWASHRMIPLTFAENNISQKGSMFRDIPILYWAEKAIQLIVRGYVTMGSKSKFDFGPIDTFISHNATEGWRLLVGGMTTANLSRRIFARGYVAYGFGDKKWKYYGELEYSFNDKKYHSREFPVNSIRGTYMYDVYKLGQNYVYASTDNLLSSIKRLDSNLSTYRRFGSLEYNIEWMNHLSFHASVNYARQEDSEFVRFVDGNGRIFNNYTENTLKLKLRWAPGERFTQTYNERHYVNRDMLTLQISHEFGPKGLFGSLYTLNLTEFMMRKRISLSAFGNIDFVITAGKLWNQVQFPALLWQSSNLAYTMRPGSYALLNPMEFAMDEYASLDFTYNLNGLIFNRIPWVNKLRLREVFTFKGFCGHLTKKNNPDYNPNLFRFPDPATQAMGNTPYMEIGAGIANILTFLRLDYVWRLSYRDKPKCPNSGLRFSFEFTF